MSAVLPEYQVTLLSQQPEVLDLHAYWKSGKSIAFPTPLSALEAVNYKASAILNEFMTSSPPSSETMQTSLTNLRSSYNHCDALLKRMQGDSKVMMVDDEFKAVELYVTGWNADREHQTVPIPANVEAFEGTLKKTEALLSGFQDIVKLSFWPKYHDITVEAQMDDSHRTVYIIKRKAICRALEAVIAVILGIVVIIFAFIRVKKIFFQIPPPAV